MAAAQVPLSTAQTSTEGQFDASGVMNAVAGSSPSSAELAAASPDEQLAMLLRCIDLDGLNYCLGVGFTEARPDYAAIATSHAAERSSPEESGDITPGQLAEQRAALADSERIKEEQAEIANAVAGLGKAAVIRDLVARDDQLGEAPSIDGGLGAMSPTFPAAVTMMTGYQTRQECSNWCGPATMQMIDWADDKQKDTQASWKADLGTGACGGSGTYIGNLVSQINIKTNWDIAAGAYITQSIVGWDVYDFFRVHASHMGDGSGAPIVEHPRLVDEDYLYLIKDHSGHFQPGRGYTGWASVLDRSKMYVKIFEPFREADWTSGGSTVWGEVIIKADNLLHATNANVDQRNIGL